MYESTTQNSVSEDVHSFTECTSSDIDSAGTVKDVLAEDIEINNNIDSINTDGINNSILVPEVKEIIIKTPEVESPEGVEKETYKNPEIEMGTYRRIVDNYFVAFPEQLDTFFKKYKITYLDELDSKVPKKKIDSMLTVMKTKLAEKNKTGMFSQEATF